MKQQERDTIKKNAVVAAGYDYYALSRFQLLESWFDPFIKSYMKRLGRLPQYEHTPRPVALYKYGKVLTQQRIPTKKAKRQRKPWWKRWPVGRPVSV